MRGENGLSTAQALKASRFRDALAPALDTIQLSDGHGMTARILTYGAILQSLEVADRDGIVDDIVLGHDQVLPYIAERHYFGATVGRYANRIANGRFALDGTPHRVACNDGKHHLHGGHNGFDRHIWTIGEIPGEGRNGEAASVTLHLVSPDGEEGYPGEVAVSVRYTLDRNRLEIAYRATTNATTIVNLTNHSFFNLGGSRSDQDVMDHRLTLQARHFLPVDETLIPTDEIRSVAGTPFDFQSAMAIGARIRDGEDAQLRIGRGYDHNFIVDGTPGVLRASARLEDPVSGRVLEIAQTAPGLQVYSGNFLDGSVVGKRGRLYRQGDGVTLEPQSFPDSPNRSGFPSTRLEAGQTYLNTIVYRFSTLAK